MGSEYDREIQELFMTMSEIDDSRLSDHVEIIEYMQYRRSKDKPLLYKGLKLPCVRISMTNEGYDALVKISNNQIERLYNEDKIRIKEYKSAEEGDSISKVVELNLSRLQMEELPKGIGDFNRLVHLDLRENNLREIPGNIGNLKDLFRLVIEENNLTSLPEEIGKLSSLEYLEAWKNQLSTLPDTLGRLKSLKQLELADNRLLRLPDSIGEMQNLGILNVSGNRLKTLPESMKNLSKLGQLYIGDNEIGDLPEWILDMPHLYEIGIGVGEISRKSKSLLGRLQSEREDFSVVLYSGDEEEKQDFREFA